MFKYCATCERCINRISKMTLKSRTGKNLRMGTLATCWLSTKELTIEKIMTMPNVAIYDDSYKSKYIDTLLYESENRNSNIQISRNYLLFMRSAKTNCIPSALPPLDLLHTISIQGPVGFPSLLFTYTV